MKKHPPIRLGSWITVGTRECVVSHLYEENSPFGVCIVVFNKEKPTTHDVDWDGGKWFFPKRSDYGGYPSSNDKYVQTLKGEK